MKDNKLILLLLVIIGLAATLVYFLAIKSKEQETNSKGTNEKPESQPPTNTTHTNISMTAEGKPFSTLYGISQIFNSLNPLMQSIPGLFSAIKKPQQQEQQETPQEFDKELFCKIQPFNPMCNFV